MKYLMAVSLVFCVISSVFAAENALPVKGICSHRGEMEGYPENTVPAFQAAVKAGTQQIEFDVARSKDGVLVIMHDHDVKRTTDGEGKVVDLTFKELRALDAGIKTGEQFRGTKIPTFDEAIDSLPRNIWINVHLRDLPGLAEETALKIREKGRLHQAFLTCGRVQMLEARKVCPEIMICNVQRRKDTDQYVWETIEWKCNFIQLQHALPKYSEKNIADLKKAGVHINWFGTDDPQKICQLIKDGVEFPLVNKTRKALKLLKDQGLL
ncbi:MAG: glycerophosphodiester phosphodiesterase family protein [Planctomycetia bacterium]|nr:glycerophosphodiester phosphodiesterase family protein [Planctomycetia bacterium]